jgi:phosphoketolase
MHDTLKTLAPQLLKQMHAYWRAANYLSVGHKHYIDEHGEDIPEIRDWKWTGSK